VCAISSLTSTFAISSPDEFLLELLNGGQAHATACRRGVKLTAERVELDVGLVIE